MQNTNQTCKSHGLVRATSNGVKSNLTTGRAVAETTVANDTKLQFNLDSNFQNLFFITEIIHMKLEYSSTYLVIKIPDRS